MLKGENIVLRPLQDSDLDFLRRIENNTDNWEFGSERKKYSKKELISYIKNAKTDIKVAKQYRFVIDLNSTLSIISGVQSNPNRFGIGFEYKIFNRIIFGYSILTHHIMSETHNFEIKFK